MGRQRRVTEVAVSRHRDGTPVRGARGRDVVRYPDGVLIPRRSESGGAAQRAVHGAPRRSRRRGVAVAQDDTCGVRQFDSWRGRRVGVLARPARAAPRARRGSLRQQGDQLHFRVRSDLRHARPPHVQAGSRGDHERQGDDRAQQRQARASHRRAGGGAQGRGVDARGLFVSAKPQQLDGHRAGLRQPDQALGPDGDDGHGPGRDDGAGRPRCRRR